MKNRSNFLQVSISRQTFSLSSIKYQTNARENKHKICRTVHSLIAEDDNACCIWTAWKLGTPLDENINMNHIESEKEDSEAVERAPPDWVTNPCLDYV